MGPIHSLADAIDLIRRRIGVIVMVVVLGCVASLYYALSQTHIYRSAEVIQLRQPKIANDLARSTVEGSAARRLQLIQQQLMARASLQDIIDTFGLYDDLPGLLPSEKVHMLRMSVDINGVAAPQEGFGEDGTISILTIAARMDDPVLAQRIAHEFADRTRNLAAQQRMEQSAETLAFFEQQEAMAAEELTRLEDEIVAFRSANNLSLDGNIEVRRSELSSLNETILDLDREIIAAELARSRIDLNARAATVRKLQAEADAEIESLMVQRKLLRERRDALSTDLETSPEIERALTEFDRRRSQLQRRLETLASRRTDAEVGFSLESGDRGERLTTLEEAQVPDYPITTSRRNLAVQGAAVSIVLALGLAFLLDLLRPVIRSPEQMKRETGLMPVVSVPTVRKSGSLSGLWRNRVEAGKRGRDARQARASRAR